MYLFRQCSANRHQISVLRCDFNTYDRQFSLLASPTDWNSQPDELRNTVCNDDSFKQFFKLSIVTSTLEVFNHMCYTDSFLLAFMLEQMNRIYERTVWRVAWTAGGHASSASWRCCCPGAGRRRLSACICHTADIPHHDNISTLSDVLWLHGKTVWILDLHVWSTGCEFQLQVELGHYNQPSRSTQPSIPPE